MMTLMLSPLPEWMYPPREEGWFAEDLDRLPEAPRHTELMHGALVFRLWPQTSWHSRIVNRLTSTLARQASEGVEVGTGMTIRLDDRNRLEPDIVATTASYDPDRTWFKPGIPHYWVIDEEPDGPAVHQYDLDRPTARYGPAGVARGRLQTSRPFPIDINLTSLA